MENYEKALHEVQLQLGKFNNSEFAEASEVVLSSTSLGRLIYSGTQYAQQKRFEAFLKGICNNENFDEKYIIRLKKYINNEKRAEFISDQINNILRTHSKKATLIMGLKLYNLVETNKDPSYGDLILLNALINLYDKDLVNLQFILTELEKRGNFFTVSDEIYDPAVWYGNFQQILKQYEGPLEEYIIEKWNMKFLDGLEYTIPKAISYNLLFVVHDIEGPKALAKFFRRDYLPEYTLKVNNPGKELLKIIENINLCR